MKGGPQRISNAAIVLLINIVVLTLVGCEATLLRDYFKELTQAYEWETTQYVSGGTGTDFYHYGWACDMDGSNMIIGAKNVTANDGRVYMYQKINETWKQQQVIFTGENMVEDVAISGEYAIFGDPNKNVALIYKYVNTEWVQVQTLSGEDGSLFGNSVSIYGDYAIVGAYGETVGEYTYSGKAYVYYKNSGGIDNWGLLHDLQCSDSPTQNLEFGYDVALTEKYALISAKKYALDQGAVYIYERTAPDQWGTGLRKEHTRIVPANPISGDYFGTAVAIDGSTAVVGFMGREEAVIYKKAINLWEPTTITALTPTAGNGFGRSLAVSGNYVITGAEKYEGSNFSGYVPAYVFEYIDDLWIRRSGIGLPSNSEGSYFNAAVGISGGTAVVGMGYDDQNGKNAGGAVVLKRVPKN